MMGYSSRHWLDSLVDIQSSKSADVRAEMCDTLRMYSLSEGGKQRQTMDKQPGEVIHYFDLCACMQAGRNSRPFVCIYNKSVHVSYLGGT